MVVRGVGGLHKINSILVYSSNDLCRMLNVSSQDVEILVLAASNVVIPSPPLTARDSYMRQVKLHNWGLLDTVCMLDYYCIRSSIMGLSYP